MDDLMQWLGEQLDIDTARAQETAAEYGAEWTAHPRTDSVSSNSGADVIDEPGVPAEFIAEHDPARVLLETDAKRQLIRELLDYEAQFDSDRGCGHSAEYFASGLHNGHMPKDILGLRLIASGYSHRPGFREEWRP